MVVLTVEKIIEGIKAGKDLVSVISSSIPSFKDKKLSVEEELLLINLVVLSYGFEKLSGEYKQGMNQLSQEYRQGVTEITSGYDKGVAQITNHLSELKVSSERLYGKIEGLMEGIIFGRYDPCSKDSRKPKKD